jgi:hypothetical protein
VSEVAGVVIGDRDRHRAPLRSRAGLGEELRHVLHALGERGRALGPAGLVAEHVAVVLHR